jgi:hypothetical protein
MIDGPACARLQRCFFREDARMMKPVHVTWLALSLSAALPAQVSAEVRVMTQNQYLGADFASLAAQPPEDVHRALVQILRQIAATDFRARAQAQAEQIARRSPDLIGLQEVWALSCSDPDPSDRRGCQHPSIADAFLDHLQVTLEALDDLGSTTRRSRASRIST